MSEAIKHECGIALIRLLKPLDYYLKKYGTALYGLNALYLMMEKQHNRGQDGAGVATIKLNMESGYRYISRQRSNSSQPIRDVFERINRRFDGLTKKQLNDPNWLKKNKGFIGELLLGHLRYGTHGKNSIEFCHPFLRQNNWMTRNLILAGNFNLTNVPELFNQLVDLGQHPKEKSDTVTVLEKIGHFLDAENERLYKEFKKRGKSKRAVSRLIGRDLDIQRILQRASKNFDGGYTMAGLIGHGDAFVMRDPIGIRPAYWFKNDEIVVVASERPPIQTTFNVDVSDIHEVKPGHALVIKKNGKVTEVEVKKPMKRQSCSFERIYFSRGTDVDIYRERMELGRVLTSRVLKSIDYDVEHTVFSYIPNTAEVAFYGLIKGVENYLNQHKLKKILQLDKVKDKKEIERVLGFRPRVEKAVIKDHKMRTFITEDSRRDSLVAHIYDITYGAIERGVDTLVLVDDSIVRGTTLEKSILKIVDRLGPKKIVIVSSAPQIRYPDCYGIDMSKMHEFIAFRAVIELTKESGNEKLLKKLYAEAKKQLKTGKYRNVAKDIYKQFTAVEISARIASMIKTKDIKAEVEVVYQTIEDLHKAIPEHTGDWYFTGDFPTKGGNRVMNKAFMNYMEGKDERAY